MSVDFVLFAMARGSALAAALPHSSRGYH